MQLDHSDSQTPGRDSMDESYGRGRSTTRTSRYDLSKAKRRSELDLKWTIRIDPRCLTDPSWPRIGSEISVLLAIEGMARMNRSTWVSDDKLSLETRIPLRTVQKVVPKLAKKGWFKQVYEGSQKRHRLGLIMTRRVLGSHGPVADTAASIEQEEDFLRNRASRVARKPHQDPVSDTHPWGTNTPLFDTHPRRQNVDSDTHPWVQNKDEGLEEDEDEENTSSSSSLTIVSEGEALAVKPFTTPVVDPPELVEIAQLADSYGLKLGIVGLGEWFLTQGRAGIDPDWLRALVQHKLEDPKAWANLRPKTVIALFNKMLRDWTGQGCCDFPTVAPISPAVSPVVSEESDISKAAKQLMGDAWATQAPRERAAVELRWSALTDAERRTASDATNAKINDLIRQGSHRWLRYLDDARAGRSKSKTFSAATHLVVHQFVQQWESRPCWSPNRA